MLIGKYLLESQTKTFDEIITMLNFLIDNKFLQIDEMVIEQTTC